MIRTVVPILFFAVAALFAVNAQSQEAVARGKTVVVKWCANCHGVEGVETPVADDAAPTLRAIANKRTDEEIVRTLTNVHYAMPTETFSRQNIADVTAYLATLRE